MAQRPGSGGSISSSTSGAADTSLTKIFVGGLAWETECESMRRYFEQFGEIAEAVVIVDKHTGRSKGYGFVTFLEAEAARRACANPAPFIDGRRTNCNLAVLGAHRSRAGSPMFQGRARFVPYLNDFGVQAQQAYGGSPNFRQPLPFAFQPYPPSLGYPAYPSEYYASPNMYNPYMGPSQQMTASPYQSHLPPSPTFQHVHAQPPGQHEHQLQGGPFAMPPSPVNLPSYFLPPPFIHSPGPVSPSGSQGASTPRFVLQAPPFTPGGGPERQSPS